MDLSEFLALIWPAGDHFFVTSLEKAQAMRHYHVTTPGKGASKIKELDRSADNVYYAMASFKEPFVMDGEKKRKRTQTNVAKLKCLWIDLDCKGRAGDYADARAAMLDIKRFCDESGVQLPTLTVASGYGMHAYWVLDRELDADTWTRVAFRWKALLDKHGVKHDAACTTDCARVLRPIETRNKKDGNEPMQVRLVGGVREITNVETLIKLTPSAMAPSTLPSAPAHLKADTSLNDMAVSVMDYPPASILEIVKSCQLVRQVGAAHGNVPEPLWYATLGVVKHTTEADRAVHIFSNGYPGYSVDATENKARQWVYGPTSCEKLESVAGELCHLCAVCPSKGTIKSPIQLGSSHVKVVEINELTGVEERIDELPESMKGFRWDGTNLQRSVRDKDASEKAGAEVFVWKTFCGFFFYPFSYYRDELGKLSMLWKVREREGVWREFELSGAAMGTGGIALFKELGTIGILSAHKGKEHMEAYTTKWFDEIKRKSAGSETYTHFGWHGKEFLLGETMYAVDGKHRKVRLANGAAAIGKHFVPSGSLDNWKHLIKKAYSHANQEQYQFILGVGFGAPLMEFMNVGGGLVFSAVSSHSGEGKTYSQQRALSIFGDPSEGALMLSKSQATYHATFAMAGILHNLPILTDEMTNQKADLASDTVYTFSQGSPRVGLRQDGMLNQSRHSWKSAMMTNGNKSLGDIITSAKPGADAEMARIFEFSFKPVSPLSKAQADDILVPLSREWGYAGMEYISYIVQNMDEVHMTLAAVQKMVDEKALFVRRDRFWSAGLTVAITGLVIAKKLGLIDFSIQGILNWAVRQANELRGNLAETLATPEDMFTRMLHELSQGMIITDKEGDKRSNEIAITLQQPRTAFTGRAIVNKGEGYLLVSKVRDWCAKHQVEYRSAIDAADKRGWLMKEKTLHYTIGKGTEYMTGPARCIALDWNKLDLDRAIEPSLAKVIALEVKR